jgi:hypothetical protein
MYSKFANNILIDISIINYHNLYNLISELEFVNRDIKYISSNMKKSKICKLCVMIFD